MSRGIQILLSVLISAAALWFSLHDVQLGSFFSDLARARIVWLVPMIAFAGICLWFRALRWRVLLETLGPLGDAPVFYATCIGFMGNMVLPLRAGDAIKPIVVARGGQIGVAAALATVALELLCDMIMLALFAVITLFLVPGATALRESTPWVLALDADYVLSSELIAELGELRPEAETVGYRAKFEYCINGKRLRSGIYPPVTLLYRRDAASYVQDGHTQRVALSGMVKELRGLVMHDDRKSLRRWLRSQARYTELEAQKLLTADASELGLADRMRRWCVVVPPVMLGYCLIVRGGVLDGWQGFYYAFQRSVAELMLSANLGRRLTRMNADKNVHTRY